MFEAALKGDWKTTKKILNEDSAAMEAYVMTTEADEYTVLEVAIMAKQDQLVENMIKHFPEYPNPSGALFLSARWGRIRIVKALADKVDYGSDIITNALNGAVMFSPMQKEVIWYLAKRTIEVPDYDTWNNLIDSGHLGSISHLLILSHYLRCSLELTFFVCVPKDILLYLACKYRGMLGNDIGNLSFLELFVTMTPYFRSGAKLNFWHKPIYKCR